MMESKHRGLLDMRLCKMIEQEDDATLESTSALESISVTKVMWLSRVLGAMRVRAAGRPRSLVNTLCARTSCSLESSRASSLAPVGFTAPDRMRWAYSCKPDISGELVNGSKERGKLPSRLSVACSSQPCIDCHASAACGHTEVSLLHASVTVFAGQ